MNAENAPNPFETAGSTYGKPPEPTEKDSAAERSAKRGAIARWYQARRDAARLRRNRRAQDEQERVHRGENAFNVMGRWAIEQAVTRETDPASRRRRRNYLMQRWRTFMRQTFRTSYR